MPSRNPNTRFILVNEQVRHNAVSFVSSLREGVNPPWVVEVYEHHRDRSLAQNRLYWYWLGLIARHINDTGAAQVIDSDTGEITDHVITSEDIHEFYRQAFIPERVVRIRGRVRRVRKSTTTLTVEQFSDYLNRIEAHVNDRLDFVLPHPADYQEAMGGA